MNRCVLEHRQTAVRTVRTVRTVSETIAHAESLNGSRGIRFSRDMLKVMTEALITSSLAKVSKYLRIIQLFMSVGIVMLPSDPLIL